MFGGEKKERRNSRICIYSINAPHQNYDFVFCFFFMFFFFFMLCLKVCIYADPCTVEEQKQI